jgi:hypothetical protein
MKRLIGLACLIMIPFALSTQMIGSKRYVVEFKGGKRICCDSFALKEYNYTIDVIDYECGYTRIRTYKMLAIKNLLPADSTCRE